MLVIINLDNVIVYHNTSRYDSSQYETISNKQSVV